MDFKVGDILVHINGEMKSKLVVEVRNGVYLTKFLDGKGDGVYYQKYLENDYRKLTPLEKVLK